VSYTDLDILAEDWDEDVESIGLVDDADRALRVLINHAFEPWTVDLAAVADGLLTGEQVHGRLELPGNAVYWLRPLG
jgi:hypothetical protein